jgi:nucleoside-diphosphate-sugar epimerase
MKNILITGASGFIGSFLVEEALNRGWQTWAGIRESSSKEYLKDASIRFVDLNFTDKRQLKRQILEEAGTYGKWDYIIHNAGVTKCLNSSDFDRINYQLTRNLVEALQEIDMVPEKFIFMSSLGAHAQPSFETAYGRSKRKAEIFLENQILFPYVVLCPTGVYGPREKDYFLLLKTIQRGLDVAAGFEKQKLTFIYVKDLVKAAFLALESPVAVGKTYFVTDGNTYFDEEYTSIVKNILRKKCVFKIRIPLALLKMACNVAEKLSRFTKKPPTLNRDKYNIMRQRDWTCDTRPLQNDLGFRADYDLKRGMRECVEWYRSNGWL